MNLAQMGFDQYYRRPLPKAYQSVSAINYEALFEDGSILASKILDGEIDSAKIKSITFDQVQGGTAILGGANNRSGLLSVRNEANVEKVAINKDGISIKDENGKTVIDASGLVSTSTFPSYNVIVMNDQGNNLQTISTDNTYTTVTNGAKPCTFNIHVDRATKIFIFGRADISLTSTDGSDHSAYGRLAINVGGAVVDEAFFTGDRLSSGAIRMGYDSGYFPTAIHNVFLLPPGTTTISLRAILNRLVGAANIYINAYQFSYFLLGT